MARIPDAYLRMDPAIDTGTSISSGYTAVVGAFLSSRAGPAAPVHNPPLSPNYEGGLWYNDNAVQPAHNFRLNVCTGGNNFVPLVTMSGTTLPRGILPIGDNTNKGIVSVDDTPAAGNTTVPISSNWASGIVTALNTINHTAADTTADPIIAGSLQSKADLVHTHNINTLTQTSVTDTLDVKFLPKAGTGNYGAVKLSFGSGVLTITG